MGRLYQIYALFAVLCVWYYVWKECRGCRNRKALIYVLVANLIFVSAAYRHVSAPHMVYLFFGVVALPALFWGILYDSDIILVIAAAYLPYNLVYPATFGGIQQALNGTNIVLGALLLCLATGRQKARMVPISRDKGTFVLLVFILFVFISFARGATFHGGFYLGFLPRLKWFLTPFIVFLLFRHLIRDRSTIKILFGVCLIVIAANLFYGMLEWVHFGFATYSGWKYRLGGFNRHPNFYGAFIAYYMFLIAAPMLVSFRKMSVKILMFPFLLAIRIFVPTNSRGAWIGFPPAFLAVSFFRGKAFLAAALFLAAIPLFIPGAIPNTMRGRFQYAFSRRGPPDPWHPEARRLSAPGKFLGESSAISFRVRTILWGGGLNMIRARPWGFGYGVFPHMIGYFTVERELWGSAHNMWLEIAVEMGILALLLLFTVIFFLAKYSISVYRREKDPMLKAMALGYIGTLAALMVVNLTGNRFDAVDLMAPFWVIAACVTRLRHIHILEAAEAARRQV